MIALWYLLGFVCGAFFNFALSLIASAKDRKDAISGDDTLKNIINY